MTSVTLHFEGDVGFLEHSGTPDVAALVNLLQDACRDAFTSGRTRVEVRILAGQPLARRALHRTGFRFEGLRRSGRTVPNGAVVDEAVYARLRHDEVDGPAGFTAVMNAALPRKRCIAHLLLTDQQGRICVVQTTFKDDWELPGGIVEPFESPREAAIRETEEELGLTIEPGAVLVVDWLRPHLGWEDALEVVFAGPVLDARTKTRIVADPHEISAVHWLPLTEALPHFAPFARGRLEAAVLALADGRTRYTEAGVTFAADRLIARIAD